MRNRSLVVGLALLVPVTAARAQGNGWGMPASAPVANTAEAVPAPAVAGPTAPRFQLGVSLLPILLGRVSTGPSGDDTASNLDATYGVGLSFGYRVLAGLSIGLGPQIVFHLSAKDSAGYGVMDSEREYDLMARIAYAYTVAPRLAVYAEVLPGYAIVTYHKILLGSRAPNARGMVVAGGVGAAFDVTRRLFVNVGVGYQAGSQTSHGIADHDVKTRFLRISLGAGVKL